MGKEKRTTLDSQTDQGGVAGESSPAEDGSRKTRSLRLERGKDGASPSSRYRLFWEMARSERAPFLAKKTSEHLL